MELNIYIMKCPQPILSKAGVVSSMAQHGMLVVDMIKAVQVMGILGTLTHQLKDQYKSTVPLCIPEHKRNINGLP